MCNNQPMTQPYPQTNGNAPANAMTVYDPNRDAHPGNPRSDVYIQRGPNSVPMQVVPGPSMPISVQPEGAGTAVTGNTASANLPETMTRYEYIPGFLRAHVGDLVRVEFLLGGAMTDRVGVLSEVGASYIVLEALDGSSRLMCDLYSIKFVTLMQQSNPADMIAARTSETSRSRFLG